MKTLSFGTAVRDVTPTYPVWLHGYAARHQKSTGVAEPVSIRALAVASENDSVVLVTCDAIGLRTRICDELHELIERETGVGFPNVLICCSHTHFAPTPESTLSMWAKRGVDEADPRFIEDFKTKLVEAVKESLRSLAPGRLSVARIQAPQVAFNRRAVKKDGKVTTTFIYPDNPEEYSFSPIDDEMVVLKISDDYGTKAVLVNYGCHPVTGGTTQDVDHYFVSADYPHYVREVVEKAFACPALFSLGAAGDAVPRKRYGDSRRQIGEILGNSVLMAERFFSELPPTLKVDVVEQSLETIRILDPATVKKEFEEAKLASLDREWENVSDPNESARLASEDPFSEKQTWMFRHELYPDNQHVIKAQFIQIGGVTLVSFPFEVVSEIALTMKKRFPASVLVSCAGGYQGYLPLKEYFPKGGYEASESACHFQKDAGDILLNNALNWLEKNS